MKYVTETFLLISSEDETNQLLSLSTVQFNKANKNSVKSFVELHNQARLNPHRQPYRVLSATCDCLLLGYVVCRARMTANPGTLYVSLHSDVISVEVFGSNLRTSFVTWMDPEANCGCPLLQLETKGISQSLNWEVEKMSGKRQQQKVTNDNKLQKQRNVHDR